VIENAVVMNKAVWQFDVATAHFVNCVHSNVDATADQLSRLVIMVIYFSRAN